LLAAMLLSCVASPGWGQAKGHIRSVGFDGHYRPNCWTPISIALTPATSSQENLKLLVIQEDLDRDRAQFTRIIPLTGGEEGQRTQQTFWMYFIPQPSGLDLDRAELARKLRVYLCTESGKRLAQLDTSNVSLRSLDRVEGPEVRTSRLVLVVRDSGSDARLGVYREARGLFEQPVFHQLSPADLPDNVIGYQAVDAVLWMNADPRRMSAETAAALHDYVREGGKMVVCQAADKWQAYTSGLFGQMTPVTFPENYGGVAMVDEPMGLRALRQLAGTTRQRVGDLEIFRSRSPRREGDGVYGDPWRGLMGNTFPLAQGRPRMGATVEAWADEAASVPYLVRWRYGTGAVTWVAQDLSSAVFRAGLNDEFGWYGWTRVWDHLFDWRHLTLTREQADLRLDGGDFEYARLRPGATALDLSGPTLSGMDLARRGAALVGLAIAFFVMYWMVAGPGSYLLLLRRKLSSLSWPAFGVCAAAATVVTVALVALVLRGKPQGAHISVVRMAPGEDAVVHSHLGLLIKRDGIQRIELKQTSPTRQSHLSAYPLHPRFAQEASGFLASLEYDTAVPSMQRAPTDAPPGLRVPYRSTMKKLQAKWVGALEGGISGEAQLAAGSPVVQGRLLNQTGRDLHDVWIIYRQADGDDRVLHLPDYWRDGQRFSAWAAGETIDLASAINEANVVGSKKPDRPEQRNRRWGLLTASSARAAMDWAEAVWYPAIRQGISGSEVFAQGTAVPGLVLLSIFDRLPPGRASRPDGGDERVELLRLAGRHLDVSGVVSGGHLLVLGRAAAGAPLPYALEVADEKVAAEGIVFYQMAVPLVRP
jgi:hypothetical protein